MEWMKLTAPDFVEALETSAGVCVVPLGSIEKHGDHLPLGCDAFNVGVRVRQACEKARVVMFPVIPFMENSEAMANPGAVAMRREVLMPFLWNLFDEIARNGFRKIIMVNGHGGNNFLVGYLLQDFLMRAPDYMLYLCTAFHDEKLGEEVLETEVQAHGGERETSITLVNVPELVKMGNVPDGPVAMLGRASHLKDAKPAVWWFADVPDHYVGDARPATAGKGKRLHDHLVERMAESFRSVREDDVTLGVYREYLDRRRRGGCRS